MLMIYNIVVVCEVLFQVSYWPLEGGFPSAFILTPLPPSSLDSDVSLCRNNKLKTPEPLEPQHSKQSQLRS